MGSTEDGRRGGPKSNTFKPGESYMSYKPFILAAVLVFLMHLSPAVAQEEWTIIPPSIGYGFQIGGEFTPDDADVVIEAVKTVAEENDVEITFVHPFEDRGCNDAGCHPGGSEGTGISTPLHAGATLQLDSDDPVANCRACHSGSFLNAPAFEDMNFPFWAIAGVNLPEAPDSEVIEKVEGIFANVDNVSARFQELLGDVVPEHAQTGIMARATFPELDFSKFGQPFPPEHMIPEWAIKEFTDELVALFEDYAEGLSEEDTNVNFGFFQFTQNSTVMEPFMAFNFQDVTTVGDAPNSFAGWFQIWDNEIPSPDTVFDDFATAMGNNLPAFNLVQDEAPERQTWFGPNDAIAQISVSTTPASASTNFIGFPTYSGMFDSFNVLKDLEAANPEAPVDGMYIGWSPDAFDAAEKTVIINQAKAYKRHPNSFDHSNLTVYKNSENSESSTDAGEVAEAWENVLKDQPNVFVHLQVMEDYEEGELDGMDAHWNRSHVARAEDMDGSLVVDRNDYNMVRAKLRQPASAMPEADLNGNGRIDVGDLRKVIKAFDCPRGICN
jgi:hypothetical protein